jgi:hypothetical protein
MSWISQAYNGMCKLMLSITNALEVSSFGKIEKHLQHFPPECEEDNNEMRVLKWQYTNADPIHQQQPRYYEHIYSYLGIQTIALTEMLRNYSPTNFIFHERTENHTVVEDRWKNETELIHSSIYRSLTKHSHNLTEINGFSLFSAQGLEWIFSNRLGVLFLKQQYDNNSTSQEFRANFESTTKYELKPGMAMLKAQIAFDSKMKWKSIDVLNLSNPDEDIHVSNEQSLPNAAFLDACRIIYSLAIMDCSIHWHAVISHLCVGELFNTATVRKLPCTHVMRKFLHSFTYGVFEISNVVRMVLLPDGGTLHTLFPFTALGIDDYTQDSLKHFDLLRDLDYSTSDSYNFPINLCQDMKIMWDMLYEYNRVFVQTILSAASDTEQAQCNQWLKEIVRLQPNAESKQHLVDAFLNNRELLIQKLLTIFMFHSIVTHDVSSLTNNFVSDPFIVPTMIHETQAATTTPRVQSSQRTMIAAHSSDLNVLHLNHRWGDIVLPYVYRKSNPRRQLLWDLKTLMNQFSTQLGIVEEKIKQLNKSRSYPSDALSIHHLRASICI